MPVHMIAYKRTIAASTATPLDAIADGYFPGSGSNGYQLPADLDIVAGYAGSVGIESAQIIASSVLDVGYPTITPLCRTATADGLPDSDRPPVMVDFHNRIPLRRGEPLQFKVTNSDATTQKSYGVLWLADEVWSIPMGKAMWLGYTNTDDAQATTADRWSLVNIKFDQKSLPPGKYAIVGMTHHSIHGVAARLAIPGMFHRPGVLSSNGYDGIGSSRSNRVFTDGMFGTFGTFTSDALPTLEVLTQASDDTHTGALRLIRIGPICAE